MNPRPRVSLGGELLTMISIWADTRCVWAAVQSKWKLGVTQSYVEVVGGLFVPGERNSARICSAPKLLTRLLSRLFFVSVCHSPGRGNPQAGVQWACKAFDFPVFNSNNQQTILESVAWQTVPCATQGFCIHYSFSRPSPPCSSSKPICISAANHRPSVNPTDIK
jgi:hypothetical protein